MKSILVKVAAASALAAAVVAGSVGTSMAQEDPNAVGNWPHLRSATY